MLEQKSTMGERSWRVLEMVRFCLCMESLYGRRKGTKEEPKAISIKPSKPAQTTGKTNLFFSAAFLSFFPVRKITSISQSQDYQYQVERLWRRYLLFFGDFSEL